ncbi:MULTISPECIES: hypothetical protein [unclassified Meiothermus]|uniref:DUF6839 family protein n=1 Tax=unclassified Meiothermus TaxID=370471 RepID=UPI0010226100|nr:MULTISPECIES: hypothetical protein [unclassified Meiothermus]RYM37176.1 hypothetical protein EWH23_06785 [Meiothermus sp. PNK-Is4]
MYWLARWKREEGGEPRPGALGMAWPDPAGEGWLFAHGGSEYLCYPCYESELELIRRWDRVKVGDLDGRYRLISDPQDRLAVLEHLGLDGEAPEWPHLFVWEEDGEYVEVWGCHFSGLLLLGYPAVMLFPAGTLPEPDDDPGEWTEWRDFEGPELPAEW